MVDDVPTIVAERADFVQSVRSFQSQKLKAAILAGGFGTRLRQIAVDVPKPMVTFIGIPFLEYQIRMLKEQGVTDIILCVSYMADKIKSYFSSGLRIGVNITYSEEEIPLGTAGALKKAEKYLDDIFLVLNGDTYENIDVAHMLKYHYAQKSQCTLALAKSSDISHYGSIKLEKDGKIAEFSEKAQSNTINQGLINSGCYIFNKKVLDLIEKDKNVSLEREIFPFLTKQNQLYGFIHDGYFMDIGRPESYSKFKQDIVNALLLREHNTIQDAMRKTSRNGIDIVLVVDESKKLLGVVNDRIMKEFILSGHGIGTALRNVMVKDPITVTTKDDPSKIIELLNAGIRYLPVIDEYGRPANVEVRTEKIRAENFPILRGRAPLRISFAGGGTDIPYFFDKHGGAVINTTIDKYCYATLIKRADKKIIIDSDITPNTDILIDSIEFLKYDGRLDLIKAVINIMKPDFGFELYLHNDTPPGRGLGASASAAVLVAKLLNQLMDTGYDDYKIAEIAYKAERDELDMKGGWQDQYSAVMGGFNYMEFNHDSAIIYPLRLKSEIIKELNSHLMLCYVGKGHFSGGIHQEMEKSFRDNEKEKLEKLTILKKIAIEMKDSLLKGNLEDFGRLLRESWECKKSISLSISNSHVDFLYEIGIKNGAYGGKLLGAGSGGYILFFYSPRKRNQLKSSLESAGGEIHNFTFESKGSEVWQSKNKF